ncbi:MAG: hypothetical protein Q9226_009169 [Calogaya cf. arnoldii]
MKIKAASDTVSRMLQADQIAAALHIPSVGPFPIQTSDDRSPKVRRSMADVPERASIQNLPQELYDNISGHLSDFDARNTAKTIEKYHMDDTDGSKEKHANVWSQIFRDSRWASAVESEGMKPVLLGWGLSGLYDGQQAKPGNPIFIALCVLDTA